jgi:3'-5' exonuclease
MATLVFDIETVGERWSDIDTTTKEVLSRFINNSAISPKEREQYLSDLEVGLGFSPLTGVVVSIGLYDLERREGAVLYETEGSNVSLVTKNDFSFKPRTEAAMLQDFWRGARSYDTFVTFNGRSFDVPFLILRSIAHGITPSINLLEGRYFYQQHEARHVDLADQFTFYGATYRRSPLHLYCRAFGIPSPKSHGVSGDDISTLFRTHRYDDIASYNADDVIATTALYEKWCAHLAPPEFLSRDV